MRLQHAVHTADVIAQAAPRDRRALERRLKSKLEDWRAMLRRRVVGTRQLLDLLLMDRLVFTPIMHEGAQKYRMRGSLPLGRMISEILRSQGVASLSVPNWNQILSFLQQMAQLRESAGSAA